MTMFVPLPASSVFDSSFGLEGADLPISVALMIVSTIVMFVCFSDAATLFVSHMGVDEVDILCVRSALLQLRVLKHVEFQPRSQLVTLPYFALKQMKEERLWWGCRPVRQQHPFPVQHERFEIVTK